MMGILAELKQGINKEMEKAVVAATKELNGHGQSKPIDLPPIPTKLMPLNPWQFAFAARVAELIRFAYSRGYAVTFAEARVPKECIGCAKVGTNRRATSLHFDGLAIDLNLFKDGKFLQNTEDHRELGEYWESIGGCWGGRFNDGNHYSLEYAGRK